MHLPATFLSVIRRKVTTCAVTICISHPFGRCSCVTCPCSPHPYSCLLLGELRSSRIETSGWKGRSTIRPGNIIRFPERRKKEDRKTGHSDSASSRRHRVAPLLQLREEPHHREGGNRQRSRPLQLTSGSSPRFVCFQSFSVSCVIDWATRFAILRCTTLETQPIAQIPISQTDLFCGWASGGNH